jgi:hypothetical protein
MRIKFGAYIYIYIYMIGHLFNISAWILMKWKGKKGVEEKEVVGASFSLLLSTRAKSLERPCHAAFIATKEDVVRLSLKAIYASWTWWLPSYVGVRVAHPNQSVPAYPPYKISKQNTKSNLKWKQCEMIILKKEQVEW